MFFGQQQDELDLLEKDAEEIKKMGEQLRRLSDDYARAVEKFADWYDDASRREREQLKSALFWAAKKGYQLKNELSESLGTLRYEVDRVSDL